MEELERWPKKRTRQSPKLANDLVDRVVLDDLKDHNAMDYQVLLNVIDLPNMSVPVTNILQVTERVMQFF